MCVGAAENQACLGEISGAGFVEVGDGGVDVRGDVFVFAAFEVGDAEVKAGRHVILIALDLQGFRAGGGVRNCAGRSIGRGCAAVQELAGDDHAEKKSGGEKGWQGEIRCRFHGCLGARSRRLLARGLRGTFCKGVGYGIIAKSAVL